MLVHCSEGRVFYFHPIAGILWALLALLPGTELFWKDKDLVLEAWGQRGG